MENYRTSISLPHIRKHISLSDRILTIGSCFSDTIGSSLDTFKLSANVNPFGTLYNPHSIHKVIQYAISNQSVPETTFLQRNDVFLNYDFHSTYSSMDLNLLKGQLKNLIATTQSFIRQTQWLFITYGTTWVYERNDTQEIVANCHKMPQSLFKKYLMTQKKVLDSFETMYQDLKSMNPGVNIILTVSPVRHLKDTLELNSVSKAVLRVACHTLTQQYADVHYFPAYEFLMDDLRDYRFYKPDMIHPSEAAEEYIWQKFCDQYFDEDLKTFLIRWKEIRSALAHKPFHPASSAHQQFVQETIKKLEELKGLVNVDKEMALLKKQLIH
jgi:hypothetical protein